MDLKQLQALTARKEELNQNRHSKSEEHFIKGMQALALAHQEDFSHKETVKSACTSLIESLKLNRQDIRPYLALAYLFTIVNAFDTAYEYLEAALELEPQNEVALAMQQVIGEQKQDIVPPSSDTLPSLSVSQDGRSPIDYDALYDRIQIYIVAEVKKAMEIELPPPSSEVEVSQFIDDKLDEYTEKYQYIKKELAILDEEIDTSDLERHAKPLQMIVKRLEDNAAVTHQLTSIRTQLEFLDKEVDQLLEQIQTALPPQEMAVLERQVENLLDQYDAIADQLDLLEGKPYHWQPLLVKYEELIQKTELLQDEIDGVHE